MHSTFFLVHIIFISAMPHVKNEQEIDFILGPSQKKQIWVRYVTGFEITHLPRTQQQDKLFTITQ